MFDEVGHGAEIRSWESKTQILREQLASAEDELKGAKDSLAQDEIKLGNILSGRVIDEGGNSDVVGADVVKDTQDRTQARVTEALEDEADIKTLELYPMGDGRFKVLRISCPMCKKAIYFNPAKDNTVLTCADGCIVRGAIKSFDKNFVSITISVKSLKTATDIH